MNTSPYMDKQIMDLSNSSQSNNNPDFIDLNNHENDVVARKDDILPSYDFQPIRPVVPSSSPPAGFDRTAAGRVWASADSKSSSPIRSYGSLDAIESSKITVDKDNNDAALISEIDRTMKKHADNLFHALEGVSARLSQLESRSRQLEHSLDDLKVSVGNNYGSTEGKLRQIENIIGEVQAGVQMVKDKQEILVAQLQLSKVQVSKVEQQSETRNTGATDSQPTSAPMQSHQLPPVAFTQPPQTLTPPNAPPPQNLPGPVQLPNQYSQPIAPALQRDAYITPPTQTSEAPNQGYQLPPQQQQQQFQTPTALPQPQYQPPSEPQFSQPPSQPQYSQPPSQPQYSQPPSQPQPQYPQPPSQPQYSQPPSQAQYSHQPPPPQQNPSLPAATPALPQPPLAPHPEEAPYPPSQSYLPRVHQPSGAPASQQYYSNPSHMYEPPLDRPGSTYSSPPYGPSSGQHEPYQYGGTPPPYASGSPMKSKQHSSAFGPSDTSGYPQLPTARILPQALPTATAVGGGSGGSGGSGNRVPIDDVVDKVTTMGFPRDQVRGAVRKLTENGQSVDLNVVLDKLMNDGVEGNPPRGWFGR